MIDDDDTRRMRWASRRGLLELDLLLAPFMDQCFAGLAQPLRNQYRELMSCEDQQILNWIMGREIPAPTEFEDIVQAIRANNDRQPPVG